MGDTIPMPTDEALKLATSCKDSIDELFADGYDRTARRAVRHAAGVILQARQSDEPEIEIEESVLGTIVAEAGSEFRVNGEHVEIKEKGRNRLIGAGAWADQYVE